MPAFPVNRTLTYLTIFLLTKELQFIYKVWTFCISRALYEVTWCKGKLERLHFMHFNQQVNMDRVR